MWAAAVRAPAAACTRQRIPLPTTCPGSPLCGILAQACSKVWECPDVLPPMQQGAWLGLSMGLSVRTTCMPHPSADIFPDTVVAASSAEACCTMCVLTQDCGAFTFTGPENCASAETPWLFNATLQTGEPGCCYLKVGLLPPPRPAAAPCRRALPPSPATQPALPCSRARSRRHR